jgi:hypothetical protein
MRRPKPPVQKDLKPDRLIQFPKIRLDMVAAGSCLYCDEIRARKERMYPPHDASVRCESGKRPHCSCDVCF